MRPSMFGDAIIAHQRHTAAARLAHGIQTGDLVTPDHPKNPNARWGKVFQVGGHVVRAEFIGWIPVNRVRGKIRRK